MNVAQEMRVVAVGMDPQHAQPVLLLQEAAGQHRVLPVWVGMPEATAIELERQHVETPRPTTHRLLALIINSAGRRLQRVRITMVRDSIFHAELEFDGNARVSSRVSDAVALALHLGAPISAEDAVLDEVGLANAEVVDVSAGETASAEDPLTDPAEEIERFRKFLDDASPEDFGPD